MESQEPIEKVVTAALAAEAEVVSRRQPVMAEVMGVMVQMGGQEASLMPVEKGREQQQKHSAKLLESFSLAAELGAAHPAQAVVDTPIVDQELLTPVEAEVVPKHMIL